MSYLGPREQVGLRAPRGTERLSCGARSSRHEHCHGFDWGQSLRPGHLVRMQSERSHVHQFMYSMINMYLSVCMRCHISILKSGCCPVTFPTQLGARTGVPSTVATGCMGRQPIVRCVLAAGCPGRRPAASASVVA